MAKLLVVEGVSSVRANISSVLESLGHEVVEASNGKEGLNSLKNNADCQLAFVDADLAAIDGLTMIQTVMANEYGLYPDLPFVLLVTESNAKKISLAKLAGVKATCIKPVKKDLIETLLLQLL